MNKLILVLSLAVVVASSAFSQVSKIAPKRARELLASDKNAILLDVRTLEEFTAGRIQGSILFPYDEIDQASATKIIGPKDRTIIVYCRSGRRSEIAAAALASLGYTKIFDLGAISSWPYGMIRGMPKNP
jgi:rhodanese-related sulfurtransferase